MSDHSQSVLESQSGTVVILSFEHFIGNKQLLQLAAKVASTESGFAVATPSPIKISTNRES